MINHYAPQITPGTGDPKRIALLLWRNGIGDDIHALPGVWSKLQEGYRITVYVTAFRVPLWQSLGWPIEVQEEPKEKIGFLDNLRRDYGAIYSLSEWCLSHDAETEGRPAKGRIEQFCDAIGTSVPQGFDLGKALAPLIDSTQAVVGDRIERPPLRLMTPTPRSGQPHIVVALTASSPRRSYGLRFELLRWLRASYCNRITYLGREDEGGVMVKDIGTLVAAVASADIVVSVDTGVLAIALALGIPTVALLGGTRTATVVDTFKPYVQGRCVVVRTEREYSKCDGACSHHPAQGFDDRCSQERPTECMIDITPFQAFWAVVMMERTLTPNQ